MNKKHLARKEVRVTYWETNGTLPEPEDTDDIKIGDMYGWEKEGRDKYRLFGTGAPTASV